MATGLMARSRFTLFHQLRLCLAHPLQVAADDLSLRRRPTERQEARHMGGGCGEYIRSLSKTTHRLSPSSSACSVLVT